MEKLKIYSAYLPYGLKLQYFDDEREILHNDCKMVEFREDEMTIANNEYQYDVKFYDVKPILFSLEDLTKEITIGGEIFVPLHELFKIQYKGTYHEESIRGMYCSELGYNRIYSSHLGTAAECVIHINNLHNNEYWKIEKLLEWKFNVFNLPEIEYIKVTEENNPYK